MSSAPKDRTWMEDAACRDQPPARFTDPAGAHDIHQARRTCAACPVRQTCLDVALARPAYADPGIWGGTTPIQRRHIRKGRITPAQALDGHESPRRPHPLSVGGASLPPAADPATSTPVEYGPTRGPSSGLALEVRRDEHGDYVDASGRVIIFRISGQPPYMLMVDHRPILRAETVQEAAQHAWTRLDGQNRTGRPSEANRRHLQDRGGSRVLTVITPAADTQPIPDGPSRPFNRPTRPDRAERTGRGR